MNFQADLLFVHHDVGNLFHFGLANKGATLRTLRFVIEEKSSCFAGDAANCFDASIDHKLSPCLSDLTARVSR